MLDDSSLITAYSPVGDVTCDCNEAEQPSLRVFEAFQDLTDFQMLILDTGLILSETLNRENLLVMCHEFRTHRIIWEEKHDDDSDSHCDEADD